MLRGSLAFTVAVALIPFAAGCGSTADNAGQGSGDAKPADVTSRVERCTERFMRRASAKDSTDEVRRYATRTYCKPFDKRGWVHEDGTLSIDSYRYVQSSGTCATAAPGQPAQTVPCEELDPGGPLILDCAILHLVPRTEVRTYVAKLGRNREVQCDDDTPLSELGAS
jgi:hypothetical protein